MKIFLASLVIVSFTFANSNPVLRTQRSVEQYGLFSNTKCFDELGCYNTNDFFDISFRPINTVPDDRKDINVRFALYTRKTRPLEPPKPHFLKLYDTESVKKSPFDPKKPIKFIVHGFLDTGFLKWVNEMGNAILDVEDVNVISVDWSMGGGLPYLKATANTWVVGGELALFIKFLGDKFGVRPQDCHVIGHSLGSHVAGYAGARLNGALGRISALDPAEPYFQYMPENIRLDPSDAQFVDAIHTDGKTILLLGFGMSQPVGHVDFYPNDGKEQPGCSPVENIISLVTEGLQDGIRKFAACNHLRVLPLYTETIKNPDSFLSHECKDYELFLDGKCRSCGNDGSKCARMGYFSEKYANKNVAFNKKFYLTTDKEAPFGMYHYVVRVSIEDDSKQKEEKGHLQVSLYGNKNQLTSIPLNSDSMTLRRGHSYQFLVKHRKDVGEVQRLDFSWKFDRSFLDITSWFHKPKLYISSVQVEPLDKTPEKDRLKSLSTLCQSKIDAIKPDTATAMFVSSKCKLPPY